MIEKKIDRLKRRDEIITDRFLALSAQQYKGKKKFTNEAILTMLADEFPPLSESYIEKIVFDRVTYKTDQK